MSLHLLELLGTTLHALHLLVKCLDGVFKVTDGGGLEVGHGVVDELHLTFGLLDVHVGAVNLLVILLHEGDHLLLTLADALQFCLYQLQLRSSRGVHGCVRVEIGHLRAKSACSKVEIVERCMFQI